MSPNHWTKKKTGTGRYGLVAGARPLSPKTSGAVDRDYPLWSELTPRMKEKFSKFLKQVEKTGAINRSRKKCKLGNKSIQALRRNPELESKVLDAFASYTERMETKVDNRAFEGVDDPIMFEGEVVGYKKKYSDALAMFRLRGLAPEKYAEKHQHQHQGQVEHTVKIYVPQNNRDPQLASPVPQASKVGPPVLDNKTGQPVDDS